MRTLIVVALLAGAWASTAWASVRTIAIDVRSAGSTSPEFALAVLKDARGVREAQLLPGSTDIQTFVVEFDDDEITPEALRAALRRQGFSSIR